MTLATQRKLAVAGIAAIFLIGLVTKILRGQ